MNSRAVNMGIGVLSFVVWLALVVVFCLGFALMLTAQFLGWLSDGCRWVWLKGTRRNEAQTRRAAL
jgi:hypothetical protein